MRDAKVPLAYRDSCADLLIPLNRCRFETYYLPWKCEVSQQPPTLLPTPTCHDHFDRETDVMDQTSVMNGGAAEWMKQREPTELTDDLRTDRASQLRKVPVPRVQEARGQDERAQGGQGRGAEQLRETSMLVVYIWLRGTNARRLRIHDVGYPGCCRFARTKSNLHGPSQVVDEGTSKTSLNTHNTTNDAATHGLAQAGRDVMVRRVCIWSISGSSAVLPGNKTLCLVPHLPSHRFGSPAPTLPLARHMHERSYTY
ncbi:hypothetical protein VTJ49DRAFT_3848 [Mycothermus thermophilus]|uniref:NADH dehydrogenase [ubiquinone] 1 beta subcomplex subunit 7 n=1 Tax=Humicola insolens TaxID=85995 RepID=A0ABR3VR07_HUMIN